MFTGRVHREHGRGARGFLQSTTPHTFLLEALLFPGRFLYGGTPTPIGGRDRHELNFYSCYGELIFRVSPTTPRREVEQFVPQAALFSLTLAEGRYS